MPEDNHNIRRMNSIIQISFYLTNDPEIEMHFGYKKVNAFIHSFKFSDEAIMLNMSVIFL